MIPRKSLFAYVFLLLVCMNTSVLQSKTISETLHAYLLGSEPASAQRAQKIQEALVRCGISHAYEVPIYNMNGVGPFLAGQELYSFTADGIWINEKLIEKSQLTDHEQEYLYRHEAAHYAAGHHSTMLKHILPLPFLYLALYKACSYGLDKYAQPLQIVTAALASCIITKLYAQYHLKPLSDTLCQEADYLSLS